MTGEIRLRIPLVILPIVVLLGIALVTFGFSRVLLALEAEVATVIALVSAANLLGACAFVALRPDAARRRWAELAAVVLYPVLIGIAIAVSGYGHVVEQPASAANQTGAQGQGNTSTIVAENSAFTTDTLEASAGEEVSYTLDNRDEGVTHNFALYESGGSPSPGDKAIYTSADTTGPASVDITFTAPKEPGDYPYICDYHPTSMKGTLTVSEAGGGTGGTGGTGGGSKNGGAKKGGAKNSGGDG